MSYSEEQSLPCCDVDPSTSRRSPHSPYDTHVSQGIASKKAHSRAPEREERRSSAGVLDRIAGNRRGSFSSRESEASIPAFYPLARHSTPPSRSISHNQHVERSSLEREGRDTFLVDVKSPPINLTGRHVEEKEATQDEPDCSWSTTYDQETEPDPEQPVRTILIPDMAEGYEEDYEADASGEKKRRRRTNKAEASVLASVFAQTQFPDADTREALASKLSMKPKAVSIWFQNRRQAMKKRASRFGGVEGVNGPTVTAASMQIFDVRNPKDVQTEGYQSSNESLRRWASLEDVASAASQGKTVETTPFERNLPFDTDSHTEQSEGVQSERKSILAPILDFISRQKGERNLERVASMPCLASLFSAQGDKVQAYNLKKDLRDLLPHKTATARPKLQRIMTSDLTPSTSDRCSILSREVQLSTRVSRERGESLDLGTDSRLSLGKQRLAGADTGTKCTLVGGRVVFPSIIYDVLSRPSGRGIWQKMPSSSSGSSDYAGSPDSNKENRDPATRTGENEDEEDEERTLRRIAGKRAAKDGLKRKRLSDEGKRYIQEADARIALQQRRRALQTSNSQINMQAVTDKPPTRPWSRAVSDALLHRKHRNGLHRVPSLEITAGRDRAIDPPPSFRPLTTRRTGKRTHSTRTTQDENAVPSALSASLSGAGEQQKKRLRRADASIHDVSLHADQRLPSRPNGPAVMRSFAPSKSFPSPALSLLSSRFGAMMPSMASSATRFETARESCARLDGTKSQHQQPRSTSSSQASSENGSDEWFEAWAEERRKENRYHPVNVLNERTNMMHDNSRVVSSSKGLMTKMLVSRHDDSGFYGSDSGEDDIIGVHTYGEQKRGGKRHLVSQDSSSPSKRGDEDRLAAETLLGLGSRSLY